MKQGTIINRIVMLLLAGAILAYFGGAAWKGLRSPYPTVQAYSYAVEDIIETTGYLAREEKLITGSGDIVRLLPNEGEKVAAGAVVARLYGDELSLERSQRLETLESEVAQLTAAIAAAGESTVGDNAGEKVADTMIALRSSVEGGDFTRLESQVSAFKSAVYQQAQRYGSAGDLSAAIAAAQGEIEALRAQTAQSIGEVTVEESGIFSGQVDGYESVLTAQMLEGLTPSDLDALERGSMPVPESALGKLITDASWNFICSLTEEEARRLSEGGTVRVRFSRDWSGEVDMTVDRIGAPEDGRVAVILSSHRFLSEVTLLRRQTVELVFSSRTGIRVPREAIRVEEISQTDKDTGEETTEQVTCVYVRVGAFAERKPVNVLGQGEDYTLVEALLPEDASSSQSKKALRPGDQVIVASEEIWDGKVIE